PRRPGSLTRPEGEYSRSGTFVITALARTCRPPRRRRPSAEEPDPRTRKDSPPMPSLALLAAEGAESSKNFVDFDPHWWAWAALIGVITTMLVVDLLLVHRTAHVITVKEAAIESAVWISIGLVFGVILIVWQGGAAGGECYA